MRNSTFSQAKLIVSKLNSYVLRLSFAKERNDEERTSLYEENIADLLKQARIAQISLFVKDNTGFYNLGEDSKNLRLPSFADILWGQISQLARFKIHTYESKIRELTNKIESIALSKLKERKPIEEELAVIQLKLATVKEMMEEIKALFYPKV
jgi:hypothetical protein